MMNGKGIERDLILNETKEKKEERNRLWRKSYE